MESTRMKMFILFIGGVLLLGVVFWWMGWFPVKRVSYQTTIHDQFYTVEVADTQRTQARGLGGRASLCESCGMLFLFEQPGARAFWMKGMQFPLDIVWLLDGTVVYIERHVSADSELVYRPGVLANQVLEVNAGRMDALVLGEKIRFSR